MKTIPLTKGKIALVSDSDYAYLMQWKWWFSGAYAACSEQRDGKKHTIYMHKEVACQMGLQHGQADHRNHDKLDNRRRNLRPATNQLNGMNRGLPRHNTSGFKGVCWHKAAKKWMAYITIHTRLVYLGLFNDKRKAARAYNAAAKKLFGPFAFLNAV